jgi:NMD protein affecting ribosome stability and mRNA decay
VVYCMWGELCCVCCRWTEPHSKRIKVKLTVQAEVYAGTVLEQQALVEFVVTNKQCRTCAREESALGQWVAVVQLRQRGVTHRRTFLLLEQLIIRHHAQRDCVSLKPAPQGIDFFFTERGAAAKFVSVQGSVPCAAVKESSRVVVRAFLCVCVCFCPPRGLSCVARGTPPARRGGSCAVSVFYPPAQRPVLVTKVRRGVTTTGRLVVSQGISHHVGTSTSAMSLAISPVCKHDLVALPKALARQLGGVGPLLLCTRVASALRLLCPVTCAEVEVRSLRRRQILIATAAIPAPPSISTAILSSPLPFTAVSISGLLGRWPPLARSS